MVIAPGWAAVTVGCVIVPEIPASLCIPSSVTLPLAPASKAGCRVIEPPAGIITIAGLRLQSTGCWLICPLNTNNVAEYGGTMTLPLKAAGAAAVIWAGLAAETE